MEVGGRWSEEAHFFLEIMASAKARDAPLALRGSVFQTCKHRWTAMLAVAGMRSFANTLLEQAPGGELHEGACPTLGQLLCNEAHTEAPTVSRMPARA